MVPPQHFVYVLGLVIRAIWLWFVVSHKLGPAWKRIKNKTLLWILPSSFSLLGLCLNYGYGTFLERWHIKKQLCWKRLLSISLYSTSLFVNVWNLFGLWVFIVSQSVSLPDVRRTKHKYSVLVFIQEKKKHFNLLRSSQKSKNKMLQSQAGSKINFVPMVSELRERNNR